MSLSDPLLSSPCPACARLIRQQFNYCPFCGHAARRACPTCHTALEDAWTWCPTCGARVAQNTISVPTQVIPGSMEAAESREGRQFAEDYNQRGVEFYEAERYEEATAQFERAIALDPDNGLYHCNLAVACGERGDTRRALDEYQMALKLNPSDLTARLNLGYTYGLQGRIDLARESWNQLIQIAPESPEAEEARDNLNGIEQ